MTFHREKQNAEGAPRKTHPPTPRENRGTATKQRFSIVFGSVGIPVFAAQPAGKRRRVVDGKTFVFQHFLRAQLTSNAWSWFGAEKLRFPKAKIPKFQQTSCSGRANPRPNEGPNRGQNRKRTFRKRKAQPCETQSSWTCPKIRTQKCTAPPPFP